MNALRCSRPRHLRPSGYGAGETLLTDGPAAEIKEVFGGLTLIECDGLDDALKWAARLPTASAGKVEVRPFYQVPD